MDKQKKEHVWVARVGWSKGVMCSRLEQIERHLWDLEMRQNWQNYEQYEAERQQAAEEAAVKRPVL